MADCEKNIRRLEQWVITQFPLFAVEFIDWYWGRNGGTVDFILNGQIEGALAVYYPPGYPNVELAFFGCDFNYQGFVKPDLCFEISAQEWRDDEKK